MESRRVTAVTWLCSVIPETGVEGRVNPSVTSFIASQIQEWFCDCGLLIQPTNLDLGGIKDFYIMLICGT